MSDFKYQSYEEFDDTENLTYPDFYYPWNEALEEGINPGFLDADTLIMLLDIYYEDHDKYGLKDSIPYMLKFHPDNIDLIEEILYYLNEFEDWFDLYRLTEQYLHLKDTAYPQIYKLSAMLHLGMEEEAFHSFRQLKKEYKNDKENLPLIYQIMGDALNEIQHHEAALQIANEALITIGLRTEFYWIQLSAYMSLEETEDAIRLAEKIEKLSPLDKNTWFELGKAYIELQKLDKAIDAFEFTITLGGKSIDLFMNLIRMYEANGNDMKALETAKTAIEIRPDYHDMFLMAIHISMRLGLFTEVLETIDKALVIDTEIKDVLYMYKGEAFIEMEEYKKAIVALERGIEETGDERGFLTKQLEKLREQFPYL
ncbi:hypothetical protein LJB92_03485 [Bacteroidales bacterium OttesenSCG-928-M06]|nr:hypothetical protein [Bacteroidales bacterium OttesenSCG-928-M06]